MTRQIATTRPARFRLPTLGALIALLLEADRRYRERRHMATLIDAHLADARFRRNPCGEIERM